MNEKLANKGNKALEADYLVIGGGAMGVAFIDEMINSNSKLTFVLVDRNERLGGHWAHAYPYVRLHQPALFYGVNSMPLGNGSTDLSSKDEILEYYDQLLENFIASGRVTFLGKHNYIGNHQVSPLGEPDTVIDITVNKKVVDATYMKVEVPSTNPPRFQVDKGVNLLPLNNLVNEYDKWKRFYIIGCGKSGMDAVLYLLNKGVDPDSIHWITPNDIWCFNRDNIQVGVVIPYLFDHGYKMSKAKNADEVFLEMEKTGGILRIDKDVLPTKWRCATIDPPELKKMQTIKNRIRKGRVAKISETEIHFKDETMSYPEGSLFVDCTSCGLSKRPVKPIMGDKHITLQPVVFCQQVFSAAITARFELSSRPDRVNRLSVVTHPEVPEDWVRIYHHTIQNLVKLNKYLPIWMATSRLNMMSHDTKLNYAKNGIEALWLAAKLKRVGMPAEV